MRHALESCRHPKVMFPGFFGSRLKENDLSDPGSRTLVLWSCAVGDEEQKNAS